MDLFLRNDFDLFTRLLYSIVATQYFHESSFPLHLYPIGVSATRLLPYQDPIAQNIFANRQGFHLHVLGYLLYGHCSPWVVESTASVVQTLILSPNPELLTLFFLQTTWAPARAVCAKPQWINNTGTSGPIEYCVIFNKIPTSYIMLSDESYLFERK